MHLNVFCFSDVKTDLSLQLCIYCVVVGLEKVKRAEKQKKGLMFLLERRSSQTLMLFKQTQLVGDVFDQFKATSSNRNLQGTVHG